MTTPMEDATVFLVLTIVQPMRAHKAALLLNVEHHAEETFAPKHVLLIIAVNFVTIPIAQINAVEIIVGKNALATAVLIIALVTIAAKIV